MLSTLGAFMLIYQAMVTLPSLDDRKTNSDLVLESYQKNPVFIEIIAYYDTQGPWAGTFKIDRILKARIEKVSDNTSIAHVRYHYSAIPNNSKGRTDSGIDQRTFTYTKDNQTVKVIKMGKARSAKF